MRTSILDILGRLLAGSPPNRRAKRAQSHSKRAKRTLSIESLDDRVLFERVARHATPRQKRAITQLWTPTPPSTNPPAHTTPPTGTRAADRWLLRLWAAAPALARQRFW